MVETLWIEGTAPGDTTHRQELHLIEELARQLKDAPLCEKTRRLAWKNLNAAACHDIAEVYFASGDASTALDWLHKVEKGDLEFLTQVGKLDAAEEHVFKHAASLNGDAASCR